jgi:hypothetical protein
MDREKWPTAASLMIQVHFYNQSIQAIGLPTIIFSKPIYDRFY